MLPLVSHIPYALPGVTPSSTSRTSVVDRLLDGVVGIGGAYVQADVARDNARAAAEAERLRIATQGAADAQVNRSAATSALMNSLFFGGIALAGWMIWRTFK